MDFRLIEHMEELAVCGKKYIEMTKQLNNLDNIIKDYKDLIEKLNNFTETIDSDIKSTFKMYVINQS